MTLRRLAARAGLLAGAGLLATRRRIDARAARAEASHPPEGRMLDLGGQRLHVVERGAGPDLVLIHGASGSSRDFSLSLIDRLAARFRVLAFDRPGFGHSDPLPGHGLREQADLLAAGAASLGAARPLLLGQSYGGAVAMTWAEALPAAGLVTVSAPLLPWPGALDPWYRANAHPLPRKLLVPLAAAFVPESYVARQLAAVFAPDPVPPGYLAHLGMDLTLRAGQLAVNVAQINALHGELTRAAPRWPGLSLPVDLLHGTADSIVPASIHAIPLAPRIPGAVLTLLEGVGHMPHHARPDAVIAAILRAASRAGLPIS